MSTKKDNTKNNEFRRNKKINKAKIRDGQKNKNFLNNEDSILNTLPSGAFDRKIINENNIIDKEDNEIEKFENNNIDKNNNMNKKNDIIIEEEYEEFDESYFKPQVYQK